MDTSTQPGTVTRELETRNLAIVTTLYKLTGRGKWDDAAQYLAPDLVIREADTLPFAGTFHGIEGMKQLFSQVVKLAGIKSIQMHQLTAGGDWVVSLLDLVLEASPPMRCPIAESFRLKDGKVCEIVPYYFDPGTLARAAAARQAAASR